MQIPEWLIRPWRPLRTQFARRILRFDGAILTSLLVIGLPVVMLSFLQWRSLDRFEIARRQTLEQASAFLATELSHRVEREFRSPILNLLEQIDHADVRDFKLERLAAQLHAQRHHFRFLKHVFIWSKNADEVRFYTFGPGAPPRDDEVFSGFFTDTAQGGAVLQRARDYVRTRKLYAVSHYTSGGRRYDEILHFIYDLPDRTDASAFIGFTVDLNTLRDGYFASLASAAASHQNRGLPPVAISVFDNRGQEIYRSGRSLAERYEAESKFAVLFFDPAVMELLHEDSDPQYWAVRTGFVDDIALIARGETDRQRFLWLITMAVALGGIGFTVRATAHEVRLARAKSDFVSSVSHDFKTPLSLIEMFADTLESGRARTPEKVNEYYRIISKQSRKLHKMIGGIVDFAKIEAGVSEYPSEDLDLRGVVRGAIASCEDELAQGNFRIEMELPDEDVPIRGNVEGLQQLFCNLLDNAIKYSSRDRFVRVAVRFDRGGAIAEVADHGVGIPSSELKKIFKKFYRVPQGTVTRVTGSGLGLAIVEHIALAHHARVHVASVPGRGSTFSVWFPLSAAQGLPAPAPPIRARAAAPTQSEANADASG